MSNKIAQPLSSQAKPVLSVSELTFLIRNSIESEFPDLWLEGEVSNLRTPGSGHVYCTLKDEFSQIRAVLFKSSAIRVPFRLQEGMLVIVRGRLTVYEPRGEYQIVIEAVEPKGIGALQVAFEQLKGRLAAEGLFGESRKKRLPAFPQSVGIVTSLNGAALHDILTVLNRRWPKLHIVIVPVQVQGEGAGRTIAEALAVLNEHATAEVIIIGRGGGSMEDLWSFNEEIVVRAIAASKIPVVSAVGHEIDVTLADFAADDRAPTPSAAAEAVVPVMAEVVANLKGFIVRAGQVMVRTCLSERRRIDLCEKGLVQIRFQVQEDYQRADDIADRLTGLAHQKLVEGRESVREWQQDLARVNPNIFVKRVAAMVPQMLKRLERQMSVLLDRRFQHIESTVARLNGLSPLAILGRGYSILSRVRDGKILRRTQDVGTGEEIVARLSEGKLRCSVKEVLSDT